MYWMTKLTSVVLQQEPSPVQKHVITEHGAWPRPENTTPQAKCLSKALSSVMTDFIMGLGSCFYPMTLWLKYKCLERWSAWGHGEITVVTGSSIDRNVCPSSSAVLWSQHCQSLSRLRMHIFDWRYSFTVITHYDTPLIPTLYAPTMGWKVKCEFQSLFPGMRLLLTAHLRGCPQHLKHCPVPPISMTAGSKRHLRPNHNNQSCTAGCTANWR